MDNNTDKKRQRTIWCNKTEWLWLKKQLEIYRAQQVLKKKTSGDPNESAGDSHE